MAQSDEIQEPPQMVRWRKRRRRRIAVSATLAVAVVVGGIVWVRPIVACGGVDPFSGLQEVGGECVGVTDGSYEFDPAYREIQADIKAENDWVAQRSTDTPAVKVALLSTLSTSETSPLNRTQVLHGLEGAYTAQHRANRTRELGSPAPLVQLVLANEGSTQQGWEEAAERLIAMTDDDIPLAIVMGQGISTSRTTEAARMLSDAGIPMVTGTTMADNLDYAHVPGLIRAAPSNTDATTAIRRYLDSQRTLRKGVLVFDNSSADTFSTTLREAFEAQLGKYIGSSRQPFPGSSVEQGGPDVFDQITPSICLAQADMVFFAGRAPDFEVFLASLAERSCRDDRPITAFFVDLGPNPRGDAGLLDLLRTGNITVLHAAGYDPRWPRNQTQAPKGFATFRFHFDKLVGGSPEALDDGYAITNHDSMAAAVLAVRITNPWENAAPSPKDVREHLLLLNGVNAVPGATGTLQFNDNRGGNPGGKYVPIVSLPNPSTAGAIAPYITPIE